MAPVSSHLPAETPAPDAPAPDADDTLRADARRNRDRIVAVAQRLFAERGLDVPMATVARHAGVGVATLYRHFPTRDDLLERVFADQFAHCAAEADAATRDPDPWRGFVTAVTRVCATQAVDRGFSAAFLASLRRSEDGSAVARERDRVVGALAGLVRRAQGAGALRPDVTLDDLALVVMANDGVAATTPHEDAPAASRRLVALLLSGFRASPGATALPSHAGPGLRALVSEPPSPPTPPAQRGPRSPSSR